MFPAILATKCRVLNTISFLHRGSLEVIVFIPPPPQYNQVRQGNVVKWQKLQRTGQLSTVATTPAFGTGLAKTKTDISKHVIGASYAYGHHF